MQGCLESLLPGRIRFQALLTEPSMQKPSRSSVMIAIGCNDSKAFQKGTWESFQYDPPTLQRGLWRARVPLPGRKKSEGALSPGFLDFFLIPRPSPTLSGVLTDTIASDCLRSCSQAGQHLPSRFKSVGSWCSEGFSTFRSVIPLPRGKTALGALPTPPLLLTSAARTNCQCRHHFQILAL